MNEAKNIEYYKTRNWLYISFPIIARELKSRRIW